MNQEKKEGLPDISELKKSKNIVFIIMVVIVAIGIIGVSHISKKKEQPTQFPDETYAVSEVKEQPLKEIVIEKTVSKSKNDSISSPPTDPEVLKQQIAFIQEKQKALQQRLSAPIMVVNSNNQVSHLKTMSQQKNLLGDANAQFMQQVSSQLSESVMATSIGSLNTVITEGSLIHATLEPAINSDLPGYLRAGVSEPVYSEDGSQILIPAGSRLIGQYKSGLLQGQSRIFVVWSRLITPNGISIQLGSPGVDNLGVSGMEADQINRHFWERFGTASLLSLISAGANNLGVDAKDQNNSAATYREAVASSFAQSADQSLQQDARMAPTLKTYQGKPIIVFVAKDLHFEKALQQVKPKINIF
jgi:type IV secretion system protein VirB10